MKNEYKSFCLFIAVAVFSSAVFAAVSCSTPSVGLEGHSCNQNEICMPGLECNSEFICVIAGGIDGGSDGGSDGGTDGGYWIDPSTGRWWQEPPQAGALNWKNAQTYCSGLILGGKMDWHLPSINELRSLIRGCAATQTGGTCGVMDSCLAESCRDTTCGGCSPMAGPGINRCYMDAALSGACSWYWSASACSDNTYNTWYVGFERGYVGFYDNIDTFIINVRCVR